MVSWTASCLDYEKKIELSYQCFEILWVHKLTVFISMYALLMYYLDITWYHQECVWHY